MFVCSVAAVCTSIIIMNQSLLSSIHICLNKSAQSNLGRGPHCGAVGHVRRKVPIIGYNVAHQNRPKSTPSRGPIPKPRYLPHPWTRPSCDVKRHLDPICRFSTMHWTDRPTDRSFTESLMTIGRCAPRAKRPNNVLVFAVIHIHLNSICKTDHSLLHMSHVTTGRPEKNYLLYWRTITRTLSK